MENRGLYPRSLAGALTLRLWAIAVWALMLPIACVRVPVPAQPRPVLSSEGIWHQVESGQTLYRIAKAYGVSVEALEQANGLQNPRALVAGQKLFIPGGRAALPVPPPAIGPLPEKGEASAGPRSSESREDPSEPTPLRKTPVPSRTIAKRSAATGALQWPLRGILYGRFGKKGKEPHDGIDLAAPVGTAVKTAAEGTVLFAGEQAGYGLIVIIEHENGLVTLYAHNRDVRVKTGQHVRSGQVVATVGQSGKTSGPHLHFEVRFEGVPVDPLEHLGPPPKEPAS